MSIIAAAFISGCMNPGKKPVPSPAQDTISAATDSLEITRLSSPPVEKQAVNTIETGKVSPADVVTYAKTLTGIPYKYASVDPAVGFDCSGFITYVFRHFNISVPRSSVDFANVGTEIDTANARPGDIILFTGTDSMIHVVGHMGIVVGNEEGRLQFIHSSSGKAMGVVITAFGDYYKNRFVKVIRIF